MNTDVMLLGNATRRGVLKLVLPMTAVPLFLGACSSGPLSQTQLQADVQALTDGVSQIIGFLGGLAPADILAQVQKEIDIIKANAATIATAITPSPDTITAIKNAVSAIIPLVTPFFPVAPVVGMILNAALSLLPVILGAVGMSAVALLAPGTRYTPDQARVILRGAAKS